MYKECGTACPLTCDNKDQAIMCPQMCVAGCFCPSGMVLLNDNCIQPEQCSGKFGFMTFMLCYSYLFCYLAASSPSPTPG